MRPRQRTSNKGDVRGIRGEPGLGGPLNITWRIRQRMVKKIERQNC